jgi:hypothetical protein
MFLPRAKHTSWEMIFQTWFTFSNSWCPSDWQRLLYSIVPNRCAHHLAGVFGPMSKGLKTGPWHSPAS